MISLEVCVDTIGGAEAAIAGGADRVELCSALSEGGLTPSAGLMRAASRLSVPCYAMIRPRSGLFRFSEKEVQIMLDDISTARDAELAGVVLGAQGADGGLDCTVLESLVQAAGELGKTLHRVIDVVPDPLLAVDQAKELGFERVLTSGAAPFAPDGLELIAEMVRRAAGRISVMPGCGLTPENVGQVIEATSVTEVHAACLSKADRDLAFSDFDPRGGRFVTDEMEVRRFVASLRQ